MKIIVKKSQIMLTLVCRFAILLSVERKKRNSAPESRGKQEMRMKIYKSKEAAERAAIVLSKGRPHMAVPVEVVSVGVPHGAATHWAYDCSKEKAMVQIDPSRAPIYLASTARLLTWKSGNYSRRAQGWVKEFRASWAGKYAVVAWLELPPRHAVNS